MSTHEAPRQSYVALRRPCVMLVRIDPGTEPPGLRIDDLPFTVLRVRHPLPACVRMRVMRPAVVLVGRTVLPRDFILILAAGDRIGASVTLLGGLGASDGLHEWLVRAVTEVEGRRSNRLRALAHVA